MLTFLFLIPNIFTVGVPHGLDMFYLFAIPPHGLGWEFSEEENVIIDLMGKMWTNFAKSG